MKNNIISEYIKRESLKIKSDNENRLKYVEENVAQLEQQERFYKERVEEVATELEEARTKLAIIKVELFGAEKVLGDGCKIKLYDKVKVIKNLPEDGEVELVRNNYIGEIATVISIDKNWDYPYELSFEDKDLENDYLWKREELEFTKGEW